MNKPIQITQEDLRNIVTESVKKILAESSNGSTYQELERVHQILKDIMNSGFIPFASPSPSSTEQGIKDAIIEAARNIDKAMYLCGQCGYNNPIPNIV